jgi:hypothetical protein
MARRDRRRLFTQAQQILHHGQRPAQEMPKDFDTSDIKGEGFKLARLQCSARLVGLPGGILL